MKYETFVDTSFSRDTRLLPNIFVIKMLTSAKIVDNGEIFFLEIHNNKFYIPAKFEVQCILQSKDIEKEFSEPPRVPTDTNGPG